MRSQQRRDELVRLAREAGIPIREISRLSGLSRTTIYGILSQEHAMTETARPARANRDGHPCPDWCTSDHERHDIHAAASLPVGVPGRVRGLEDKFLVYACQAAGAGPEVAVTVLRYGQGDDDPDLWLGPREAGRLAVIVGMLAAAAPARHRDLAAAIRRAAAQVTEADDG
jgi:hypothetical protein